MTILAQQPNKMEAPPTGWAALIPPEQWSVYDKVLSLAAQWQGKGIPCAMGGGLAFSHYAKRWRNTKDMDLYVMPHDRDAMIEVVRAAGLVDYFEVTPYDRQWIYRSHNRAGIIVDIMWQMANYRAQVQPEWLTRGDSVTIAGRKLQLLPAEALLWTKLYILQRDRCDWGDLLNILYTRGAAFDWRWLLRQVGEDAPLLSGLLHLFAWACPGRARELPLEVWAGARTIRPVIAPNAPDADAAHIKLLDSRDWFGPNQEMTKTTQHAD